MNRYKKSKKIIQKGKGFFFKSKTRKRCNKLLKKYKNQTKNLNPEFKNICKKSEFSKNNKKKIKNIYKTAKKIKYSWTKFDGFSKKENPKYICKKLRKYSKNSKEIMKNKVKKMCIGENDKIKKKINPLEKVRLRKIWKKIKSKRNNHFKKKPKLIRIL